MKILITSIVDLKKSQHQTFRKGLIQTLFFKNKVKRKMLRNQTLRKLDQNVQHFGWIRPHQFVKNLSTKHEVTVLSINEWWKGDLA